MQVALDVDPDLVAERVARGVRRGIAPAAINTTNAPSTRMKPCRAWAWARGRANKRRCGSYKKRERVPDDPKEFNGWLHALLPVRPVTWDRMTRDSVFIPEVLGRNVGDIRDKELRALRNDVGHLFDESDKTLRLWMDDAEQVQRVHRWLPITTCVARLLLKNEFPLIYLSGLADDGADIGLKRSIETGDRVEKVDGGGADM